VYFGRMGFKRGALRTRAGRRIVEAGAH
jgi:hypothetical protein